jgi:hypothetical protein
MSKISKYTSSGGKEGTRPHVCLFDVGSDECLICGAKAALVGQVAADLPEPRWRGKFKDLQEKVPTSRKDWKNKPHFSRLMCICVACVCCMVIGIVFLVIVGEIDADECSSDSDNDCDALAVCTNLDGSYTCDCEAGYIGTGYVCEDIDECSRPDAPELCGGDGQCINTPGTYGCRCRVGYAGDGQSCTDINECLSNNGGCGGAKYMTCTNRLGKPRVCADIKECKTNNGECGDPKFVQCNEQEGAGPLCTDFDECAVENGGCGPGMTCINKQFVERKCLDIDECDADAEGFPSHACTPQSGCVNEQGSYRCECEAGYTGALTIDSCEVVAGYTQAENVDATTCKLADGSCTVLTGLGSCDFVSGVPYYRPQLCLAHMERARVCYGRSMALAVAEMRYGSVGADHLGLALVTAAHDPLPLQLRVGESQTSAEIACAAIRAAPGALSGEGCAVTELCNSTETCLAEAAVGCMDIDECEDNNAGCHIFNAGQFFCENTAGSFTCSCANRFELEADRLACRDIDECTIANGQCGLRPDNSTMHMADVYFSCDNNYGVAQTCSGGYPAAGCGNPLPPLTSAPAWQPGPYTDCAGICFSNDLHFLGDGWCDDGSVGTHFHCADWHFDHGDCAR